MVDNQDVGKSVTIKLDSVTFFIYIVAIILVWILNTVWMKVIDNFNYHTLKLNPDSTLHAALIAIVLTIGFLVFLYMAGNTGNNIKSQIIGNELSPSQIPSVI